MSFHPLVTMCVRLEVVKALRANGVGFYESVRQANSLARSDINVTVVEQLHQAKLVAPYQFEYDEPSDLLVDNPNDDVHRQYRAAGLILTVVLEFFAAHPEVIQAIVTVLIALL